MKLLKQFEILGGVKVSSRSSDQIMLFGDVSHQQQ
jgi:hypothetical protein